MFPKPRHLATLCLLGIGLDVVQPAPMVAADFYVTQGGSDDNDGSSPDAAFATIGRGAAAIINPGDRVIVGAGEYDEGDISPARGGDEGPPVELIADRDGIFTGQAGPVIVRPPGATGTGFIVIGQVGVVIDGFEIVGGDDAGIQVRSPSGGPDASAITIRRCRVEGSVTRGIDVTAVDAVTLIGNVVLDNGTGGISLAGTDNGRIEPTVSNNTLRGNIGGHAIFIRNSINGLVQNNEIIANGLTGLTVRNASHMQIVNNLVVGNGVSCDTGRICGHGIAIGTGGEPVQEAFVINNTMFGNNGWGFLFGGGDDASRGAAVFNNILTENTLGGIAISSASTCGYRAGFNLNPNDYGPDTPFNTYDLDAEPGFVDASAGDFRLQAAGPNGPSPAVDAGATTAAELGLTGSASVTGLIDDGPVDLGFHRNASDNQIVNLSPPSLPLFVRSDGDDSADGTSPETAFASISAAATEAAAGVTVIVGSGTYVESNISPPDHSGVVVFLADQSGALTGDGGIVLVDADNNVPGFLLSAACENVIDGFHVRGGESGIQVRNESDRAWITNNVVFSAEGRGVDVVSSTDVRVTNNLIYEANGGIQITDAPLTLVANNTIFGHAFNGILVQGESPCTRIRHNILENNFEVGLHARPQPQIVEWNLNSSGYLGIERPRTDRNDTARLIDPDGADGILGGVGFEDDVFLLAPDSAAINLAPTTAADTELANLTTTSDGAFDTGRLDAGYHQPAGNRDLSSRANASALAGDDDLELCDELIAELEATPPPETTGGSGGGGCAVTKPTSQGSLATLWTLLLPIALRLQVRRKRVS